MMNKRLNGKDASKAISEVERDSNIPPKRVFNQDVNLDRILYNKLKLLGFVLDKSRNNILRNLVASCIHEFESENGALVQIARSKIQKSNSRKAKGIIKNYKSIPEA